MTLPKIYIPGLVVSQLSRSVVDQIKNEIGVDNIPDASLTDKGLVQLSNEINSNAENYASTPKATKAVNDKIGDLNNLNTVNKTSVVNAINELKENGVDIKDGSLTEKGILQLTNTINNDETKALTPKAVNTQFAKGKIEFVSQMPDEPDPKTAYIIETEDASIGGLVDDIPDATETTKGLVQFATKDDVLNGTINNKAVSPANMPKLITSVPTLYISNQGDNSTADGTEEKPFQTVQKCLDYIAQSYRTKFNLNIIDIKFLTDHTEPADLDFRHNTFAVRIKGDGHNVVLKSVYLNNYCTVQIDNITLKPIYKSKESTAINCHRGTVLGTNITIDFTDALSKPLTGGVNAPIVIRYGGYISFTNLTFIMANNPVDSIIKLYSQGLIVLNGTISIQGDATLTQGILCIERKSAVALNSSATFTKTGTITGRGYHVFKHSMFDTNGRGEGILPETTAENLKDETSVVC